MAVKMSYVVAMSRREVINSKSKRPFAIWPLTYSGDLHECQDEQDGVVVY